MKDAVLVVSFGSTHLDTIEKAIVPMEETVREAMPGVPCFRAFSSTMVCRRLRARAALEVDTVSEALDRLEREGFQKVTVVPTLLIPGEEYDKLQSLCAGRSGFAEMTVLPPLLHSPGQIQALAEAVKAAYPPQEDTLLIGMGHGTSHRADAVYDLLAQAMEPAVVCTVEGSRSFAFAVSAAKESGCRRVKLIPLLIVAGDHAKNDLAGDEPGSLKGLLEAEGFEVSCVLRGLGELPEVRQLMARTLQGAY